MKISRLDVYPLSIAYVRNETSSIINRGGVSDVVVRLTTDDGLVGWGECVAPGDTESIVAAARAAEPFLLGRDPWDQEAIFRDYLVAGNWQFQAMTGNFAFAGIDMALWDICGKAVGQPLWRLFGGALRQSVDYFFYLEWGEPDAVAAQGAAGRRLGYSVFYLKVGIDAVREEAMLQALRDAIGPEGRIRIDANQSWTLPEAARLLARWDGLVGLDFAEAPVPIDPVEGMIELKGRVAVPLCANEGLWREADAVRIIQSRAADYLCLGPSWVGSLRRFQSVARAAHLQGQQVCKHTHGEHGIAAAASQHLLLTLPNGCLGHQQTAQMMRDDILVERIPIMDGPAWGLIEGPGLGIEIDEAKLQMYHEAYLRDGEYVTWGTGFKPRRENEA
ncbi:MAG: mandelate racemase/muconate lactonizing enzyme family protein [Geminicoccaceae bacterium]